MKVVCSLIAPLARHKQRHVNGFQQRLQEEMRRLLLNQMGGQSLVCPITYVGSRPDWAACWCSHKYLITCSPSVYNSMSNCWMREERLL